jgi:hypothetical protein
VEALIRSFVAQARSRHERSAGGPDGGYSLRVAIMLGSRKTDPIFMDRSDYAFCACLGVEHTRRWSVTSRTGAEAREETLRQGKLELVRYSAGWLVKEPEGGPIPVTPRIDTVTPPGSYTAAQ